MKILYPFRGQFPVSLSYQGHIARGRRMGLSPEKYPPGVDWATNTGTICQAVADGIVTVPHYQPRGYGIRVEIEHADSVSVYAHLSEMTVTTGQTIWAGQIIGLTGWSGLPAGPTAAHLHFEYWVGGKPVDPNSHFVQPKPLKQQWIGLPVLPQVQVLAGSLAIRRGPMREAQKTGVSIWRGEIIPVLERYSNDAGDEWVCIGRQQWIAMVYADQPMCQWVSMNQLEQV